MADTNWGDFPDSAYALDTDMFLAQRGAGGINVPGSAFMRKNSAVNAFMTEALPLIAGANNYSLAMSAGTAYNTGGASIVMRGISAGFNNGGIEFMTGTGANGAEAMRILASGNIGVGLSAPAAKLDIVSSAQISGDNGQHRLLNFSGRGWRIGHSSSGTTHGNLYLQGTTDAFVSSFIGGVFLDPSGNYYSAGDNGSTLGKASNRWSVVYAGTGSINTSDERAKAAIGAIPDEWLDAWGDVEWVSYKFKDAVEEKGDIARWHFGLIAQRVRDVFESRGLDAMAIGLLCFDEWGQECEPIFEESIIAKKPVVIGQEDTGLLDAHGQKIMREIMGEQDVVGMIDTGKTRVLIEAGDRWGLRYDECQAMEAAWQRRELARKDVLIADLASRLAALEAA